LFEEYPDLKKNYGVANFGAMEITSALSRKNKLGIIRKYIKNHEEKKDN
jgi:hypothetical protein